MPFIIDQMPIKRRFNFVVFYPVPAFSMPMTEIVVAPAVYEFKIFGIGNQVGAYFISV